MNFKLETGDSQIKSLLPLFPEFKANIESTANNSIITIESLRNDELQPEHYMLDISPHKILISFADQSGLLYALQSIEHHLSKNASSTQPITEKVTDGPKLSWRGFMLDTARHFFPVSTLKKILDLMFRYKMNRFHWHLTDDQGWRLEFPEYPALHTHASKRINKDGTSHQGYYSIHEIREIVDYAKDRNIEIVPEIDLPGHSIALLSAYPELSCDKKGRTITDDWGIFEDVPCISKDSFWTFCNKLIKHVTDLFPAPWLHLGGDECLDKQWLECPECAKLEAGSHQKIFTQKTEEICSSYGKTMLGWDEILEDIQNKETTILAWHGDSMIQKAEELNTQSIACHYEYCYLDYAQSRFSFFEPKAQPNVLTLKKMYSFNPQELPSSCIGYQTNLWTEFIKTEDHLFYMLLPRLCAAAEIAWGSKCDYKDFRSRVRNEKTYWKKMKLNFRPI